MNEAEWLSGTNPVPMLDFVRQHASERDLRLFGVACCREIWPWLKDDRSRMAVAVAERFANGKATEQELKDAAQKAEQAFNDLMAADKDEKYDIDEQFQRESDAAQAVSDVGLKAGVFAHNVLMLTSWMEEKQVQLLRQMFANPFRK